MSKINLIIFDNDGVLIDSEYVWHQTCANKLRALGFEMTVEKSLALLGAELPTAFNNILSSRFNRHPSDTEWLDINQATENSYPKTLLPVENIVSLLNYLDSHSIQTVVASNADKAYIEMTHAITGVDQYVSQDKLYSCEDIQKRKPAPDIFNLISRERTVEPQACLVIEDHPLGIQAARSANMQTVGFLGGRHANNEKYRQWLASAKPDYLCNNVNELVGLIKSLI